MAKAILQKILAQLQALEIDELRLDEAIQQHLVDKQETDVHKAFHQALLESGLVKQIKRPAYRQINEQQLIEVQGQALSETIIEER